VGVVVVVLTWRGDRWLGTTEGVNLRGTRALLSFRGDGPNADVQLDVEEKEEKEEQMKGEEGKDDRRGSLGGHLVTLSIDCATPLRPSIPFAASWHTHCQPVSPTAPLPAPLATPLPAVSLLPLALPTTTQPSLTPDTLRQLVSLSLSEARSHSTCASLSASATRLTKTGGAQRRAQRETEREAALLRAREARERRSKIEARVASVRELLASAKAESDDPPQATDEPATSDVAVAPAAAGSSTRRAEQRAVARAAGPSSAQRRALLAILALYPLSSNAIGGFELPPTPSDLAAADGERIAVALGSVAHVVVMAARVLYIVLRYPTVPAASRSVIRDDVHDVHVALANVDVEREADGNVGVPEESRRFPLYPRGEDRRRFEYAVFLLNKNVEQVVHAAGCSIVSLRDTLANLRRLQEELRERAGAEG